MKLLLNKNNQIMNKVTLLLALYILCTLSLLGQERLDNQYYVKHLTFPADASLEEKVNMAAKLVPSEQQLEWQKMELTAFLHFGINTFTDREWGDGKEDPAIFNPSELDTRQWVRTLKEAGFKMVILTAKHHDGFCLWPTKTTKHSVASSPWRDGKGDVVKELRDACVEYDMKFGVYLSPWDRNASCYGDSPRYNQFFIDQLTELLTNYGEVHEVWFDGANGEGPNGKKQEYDWDRFYKTIQELQPKAVMAIMGDDVRWVGNEKGIGRETEWSATVLTPGIYERSAKNNKELGVFAQAKDLGSREILANAKELFWYPSEVDVSIRPGWFFHDNENDKVKSLKHLTNIFFESVGYNSVLLLNIPPDRRGLIHEADANRLKEFADYRQKIFADNRVKEGDKLWTPLSGDSKVYELRKDSKINLLVIQEDITKGQRMEEFTVEALVDDKWQEIAKGTTIGYKRMLRFKDVNTEKIRVNIKSTRLNANIANVEAYYAESLEENKVLTSWNNLLREAWNIIDSNPLTISLGKEVNLKAFTYAPLNETAKPTMAYRYKFYVSLDAKQWKEVPTNGEFSNIMHNPLPQTVLFKQIEKARYIRLEATTPESKEAVVEIEEIGVTVVD